MPHARPWLLALILLAIALVLLAWRCPQAWHRALPRLPKRLSWLHPRTPDDCPHCRLAATTRQSPPPPTLRPWREGRTVGGAPRRVLTEGYACRRPRCAYFGIPDAQIHALVADGHHGHTARMQPCRCQACAAKVSARWGTALSQLKTPPDRSGEVLNALAEGLDVSAAVRVFRHGAATSTRWRDRAARHAERVPRHVLHGLQLPHLQLDEIRTRLRLCARVTWLWLALDPRSPAFALEPRTQHTAHPLVHAVRATLVPPCAPVITTDGLRLSFYAITAHFGRWIEGRRRRRWEVDPALLYGQLHKRYRQRRLVRIK